MTDTIADLLTRIRNAYMAKQTEVSVPYSKLKDQILQILKSESLIESFTRIEAKPVDHITVSLRYETDGQPTMRHLKRVSRPGRRVYVDHQHLPIVLNNYGLAVVSTSRGLMTNRAARKKHLGGEILFEVY